MSKEEENSKDWKYNGDEEERRMRKKSLAWRS
jgi:hypothetical protein